MAAEKVLKLLDSYWFETTIFTRKTPSLFHSLVDSISPTQVEIPLQDTNFSKIPTLQVKSFSDQNLGFILSLSTDSPSPNSVLPPPKLPTIPSGKEVREFPRDSNRNHQADEVPTKKKVSHRHRRRPRERKTSRSLSDPEFKEIKGFMDLGFVFSEEDKDSGLVSLIPGLMRLGRNAREGEEQQNIDETVVSRPYLSESWGVLDQRKVGFPLLNWRVPALGNEIEMKENLKLWAHRVASIVR